MRSAEGRAAAPDAAGPYEMYGLRIASDLPFDARRSGADGRAVDLEIRAAADEWRLEAATAICDVETPVGRVHARGGTSGIELTIGDLYRFHLSADLGRLRWQLAAGDIDNLRAMTAGSVLAFVLQLKGHGVLHASAVRDARGATAFAGASGAGKTTLAALMCDVGAELVTDDVLRIDAVEGSVICHGGGTGLRLRSAALDLMPRLRGRAERLPDGRFRVPAATAAGPARLAAVVLPETDPRAHDVEVRRLSEREAFIALLAQPRWFGWTVPEPVRAQFDAIAACARHVPVLSARLPRLDRPRPDVVDALRAHVAEAVA